MESRVIIFRGRHGSWRLAHHHRVEGVNTAAAWVGLGDAFGNPSMESILSCGVTRKLNTIWEKTSRLNKRGEAASQELFVKDGKRDKESVYTVRFFPHNDPLCFIEGLSVFTISRRTRKKLGAKELGQAYDQPEQLIEIMKNYATSPSVL